MPKLEPVVVVENLPRKETDINPTKTAFLAYRTAAVPGLVVAENRFHFR